jgi:1,2-dihydroxy-3-keto-5-methylthiopentene dioxygenase
MSRLRIFAENDPGSPLLVAHTHEYIAEQLRKIGVRFEQWQASAPLAPGASSDEVMSAYRADIDRLIDENGFRTVDVVSIHPEHPDRETLRRKFLDEHFHKEDEVRFFVAGSGLFTLHVDGRVYEIKCEQGDLIVAIRFFTEPDGWVGHFTGTDIAQRFPRFEAEQAA